MEDKKTAEMFLKAEFSLILKLGLSIKDSIKLKINFLFSYEKVNLFKGVLSGLRRFLAIESPLKRMENAIYFTLKALFVLNVLKILKCLS